MGRGVLQEQAEREEKGISKPKTAFSPAHEAKGLKQKGPRGRSILSRKGKGFEKKGQGRGKGAIDAAVGACSLSIDKPAI